MPLINLKDVQRNKNLLGWADRGFQKIKDEGHQALVPQREIPISP
jgi:hypothetical protein